MSRNLSRNDVINLETTKSINQWNALLSDGPFPDNYVSRVVVTGVLARAKRRFGLRLEFDDKAYIKNKLPSEEEWVTESIHSICG